ncbi:uncharacterized protein LOC111404614 [Olea europaea var. sylvestris]|uniref:uncharacterized protein LOC111404614 n=1 Tax=Olea europaea var. sylvestris TaxID=158386 RepID=UPI000C1D5F01|nr:uncharacterized protein LOC111404614 [Olea europaea var. sylvestris]
MEKTNQYMEANSQSRRKTDATLQDQNVAIKNLETQMGQMIVSLTGRALETIEHDEQIKESTPTEKPNKSQDKATVNLHEPPIPFPLRLKKESQDSDANKGVQCQNSEKFPPNLKDLGSFTIPCTLGEVYFDKTLYDLGTSINLMPLSIFRKLGLGEAKATTVTLQLADRSSTHPRRIVEDVLVKVEKFIFLTNFLILDMEEDKDIPLIIGRLFLGTRRALIDV